MLASFLLPVSGLLIQDISSPAAGIAFLWFSYDHGVIWVCSYIAPIAPRMDICVLCITQSTSSLFYRLLFVIYRLHPSAAYFYPAARNMIFFTRRLTSGSRRDLFLYFSMFIIHDWCFLIHCHFSALSPAFYIYRPQLIYLVIFLAYFDILSFAMYWLLPEAGLLLDIITYPGSSPCSAYLHALLFCYFCSYQL